MEQIILKLSAAFLNYRMTRVSAFVRHLVGLHGNFNFAFYRN